MREAMWLRALALFAAAVLAGACANTKMHALSKPSSPLRTVPHVDLQRFTGDWRVIANIPNSAEKDCVDSIESYALRPDGKLETWFTFRKKSFAAPQKTAHAQAVIVNRETNAEWKEKSFGLGSTSYFVIDLDPNYQWAVIGTASRDLGWILARDKTLPNLTYETLLDRLATQGYDPGRFVKVPQLLGAQ